MATLYISVFSSIYRDDLKRLWSIILSACAFSGENALFLPKIHFKQHMAVKDQICPKPQSFCRFISLLVMLYWDGMGCISWYQIWCGAVTLEQFWIFKMSSKMAITKPCLRGQNKKISSFLFLLATVQWFNRHNVCLGTQCIVKLIWEELIPMLPWQLTLWPLISHAMSYHKILAVV